MGKNVVRWQMQLHIDGFHMISLEFIVWFGLEVEIV